MVIQSPPTPTLRITYTILRYVLPLLHHGQGARHIGGSQEKEIVLLGSSPKEYKHGLYELIDTR